MEVDVGLFARGLLLGLSIAAAVGPMSVLCMRRTLVQGQLTGLLTGAGIASADGIYALVAAFGLTAVSDTLIEQRRWMELIGGAFLLYLGVRIARSQPARDAAVAAQPRGLVGAYASALVLTLANPMTILSFVAIFAGLGLARATNNAAGVALVAGVVLGSLAWWLFLTSAVRLIRNRLTPTVLRWVNLLSGAVLTVFGALAVVSALT
ncbi:MAG TPA: LysE family transporter [Thermomicrobiales bacterium]|nr:LysE family transporter [Thermomicrobiales bacterium]